MQLIVYLEIATIILAIVSIGGNVNFEHCTFGNYSSRLEILLLFYLKTIIKVLMIEFILDPLTMQFSQTVFLMGMELMNLFATP